MELRRADWGISSRGGHFPRGEKNTRKESKSNPIIESFMKYVKINTCKVLQTIDTRETPIGKKREEATPDPGERRGVGRGKA